MTTQQQATIKFVLSLIVIATITMFLQNPIPQSAQYSHFVDQRMFFGIANFYNVISNLPFLLVGFYGLNLLKNNKLNINKSLKPIYYIMFFGVVSVFFGSSYFHLDVNNQTLFWDRLPMVVIFMSLFSLVIAEFINLKIGKTLFPWLLVLGVLSIVYWIIGEYNQAGDLRFYALIQFLPMLIIPIILLTFKQPSASGYWYLLLAYALAKVFEYFDSQIFELITLMGGHAIKHIIAAIGIYIFIAIKKQTN
jgi:hypothetical protein